MAVDVVESELRMKADQAVNSMKSLETATQGFAAQLKDVLKYLDDINKKSLGNINKQINNTRNDYQKSTFINTNNFSNAIHAVTSATGASMVSPTGQDKAFKDFQKAQIDETNAHIELTNEIKEDTKERKRLRKYRANSERISVNAALIKANKAEDKTSAAYLSDRAKIADAKLLNAKAKQAGALNNNLRYQIGRGVTQVGDKMSTMGVGGRIGGDLLSVVGKSIISPASAAGLAIAKLGEGVLDFAKAATTAYAEIESIKTQLGVVFSSQTQADSMFSELSAYAVKSPFGVQQTSELAVLLKQSGVYASDLLNTLKMIGDTAGGNMEKMKRIANNYAQIVSIGKASMLDMRQFAYAGIPIFEAVSKELGVSQQELRKLISDGKVTSDIIEKVFKDLTGVNGVFENATEIGAKTLKARLQNLADAKQLAMASAGEVLFNLGGDTGGDSIGMQLLSIGESIFQSLNSWWSEWSTKQDVEQLHNNEELVKKYTELIEDYNVLYKDKEMPESVKSIVDLYTRRLNAELGKNTVESRRSILANSYDNKTKDWLDFIQNEKHSEFYRTGNTLDVDMLKDEIKLLSIIKKAGKQVFDGDNSIQRNDIATAIRTQFPESTAQNLYEKFALFMHAVDELGEDEAWDSLNTRLQDLEEGLQAFEKSKAVDAAERLANTQRYVLQAQGKAVDTINSASKDSDSLHSDFEELYSILRNSDEVKKKEEEEKIKRLKAAQNTLKELMKNADDKGIVDQSKFTPKELLEYVNKKAFTSEALTVTENKSTDKMAEDRALVTKQFDNAILEIWTSLGKSVGDDLLTENLLNMWDSISSEKNDKTFLDRLDGLFKSLSEELETFYEQGKISRQQLNDNSALLKIATTRLSIAKEGADANVDDLKKEKGNVNIPLYKRILAEYTGLTTNGMTNTQSTMELYRDDKAIRDMTAGVLSATLKSTGLETAMNLMRTGGDSKVLPYAPGATYQVDWLKTKEAVKEFALQLSASTDVISAYTAGLEAELDTYNKLVVAGYTEGESQDLKNQKTISTKQFAQIAARGDQLVNAFGDELYDASTGKKVTFKDGKFFNAQGKEVQVEQLRMTESLFKFIQGELPRLRREIRESNEKRLNNEQLAGMLKSTRGTMLTNELLSSRGSSRYTAYLASNTDYMSGLFDTNLTELKNSAQYKGKFQQMSNDDIFMASLNGDAEAKALVDDVFRHIEAVARALVNSETFRKLDEQAKMLKRDDALNSRFLRLTGQDGNDINGDRSISPDEYGGRRGRGNFIAKSLGVGKDYDIEDLYVKAATSDKAGDFGIENARERFFNEDGTQKSNDEILKALTEQEKELISQKELWEDIRDITRDMAGNLLDAGAEFAKGTFLAPFEYLGESLFDADDAAKHLKENMKQLAADLLKNVGSAMANAGFQIAAAAAMEHNWAGVAGGLALAAAGGFASGLGNALGNKDKDEKDDEDKVAKLNKINDDLADLLKQAREDAIYYENTLRHKNAISANDSFTQKKVNDAIITPSGDIISTHPDDYLIATKTPQTLLGSGVGAPTINFSVIDKSTGIKVTQQKSTYNEDDNSIDFTAIIESKVNEFIASSKGDDAFAAREARLRGRSVIA